MKQNSTCVIVCQTGKACNVYGPVLELKGGKSLMFRLCPMF